MKMLMVLLLSMFFLTVSGGPVLGGACVAACWTAYTACIAASGGLATPACTVAHTICMNACWAPTLVPSPI